MNSIIEIDKRMELPCIIEVNVVTLQVTSDGAVTLVGFNAEGCTKFFNIYLL